MENKAYTKLLSICIPSYNRGHRALTLVRSILAMKCISERDDIEIILSNNGSSLHTEEYDEIESISDERLKYNRFEENILYWRNYNEIIKMSEAHWVLLVSDEDSLDENVLNDFINYLDTLPGTGMIKTGTSVQYRDFPSVYAKAGDEALKAFYLTGNYISGTVYNREYVTDDLIDGLKKLYEGDEGYYYYPHLFVEAYVLNIADFCFYDKILVIEGEDEGDIPRAESVSVPVFASWQTRVKQLGGYFKLIKDLGIDDDRKQLMFMMAVCKTISLIALVKDRYISAGEDWNSIYVTSGNAILDEVRKCGIEVINNNMEPYLEVTADFIREDLV
ncbi:MAG: glycosyltransferase [Lachnospiraceae bacterium]|nr:glycosyltransferase [Lachnospiraceae bacterium]